MFEKIKAAFSKPKPVKLDAKADPRGAPGTRVYHEYFLEDEPRPQGWHWLARVYASNASVTEREGHAPTRLDAGRAAIAWSEATKAGLRGES